MREAIARQIRGAQVRAPWLFGLKNAVQRGVRRRLKRPFESDFEALRALGLDPNGLILDIGGNRAADASPRADRFLRAEPATR